MENNIKLYNMDCMEYMVSCKDNEFDLAIVDPPYGINVNMNMGVRKGEKRKHKQKQWDKETPDSDYFKELFRVSKNQIIWGGNYFELPLIKYWIIWDKLITGKVDFAEGEMAWSSLNTNLKIFKHSIQNNYINEPRIHPTQKPKKLYEWLLKNYAETGNKILDTHLGSGSSAIAAYNYKFDFVGLEIDKEYFDAAVNRLNNHKAQLTMF